MIQYDEILTEILYVYEKRKVRRVEALHCVTDRKLTVDNEKGLAVPADCSIV